MLRIHVEIVLGTTSTGVLNVAQGAFANLKEDFTESTPDTVLRIHGEIVLGTSWSNSSLTGILDISEESAQYVEETVLRVT